MRGARSRLRPLDVLGAGAVGLRARRLRAAFSALGICIGIAAIVGVLGVTQSSEADLLAQIDRLGTNLLTVERSQGLGDTERPLPLTAPSMIGVLPGVQRVSPTATLPGGVYRTDRVPAIQTGGIGLRATDPTLLETLEGSLLAGTFLNAATARYPAVVLGYGAAWTLGIATLHQPVRVFAAGRWFAVAGILRPVELAPEIDRSVLVGLAYAGSGLGFDGYPSYLYVRADPQRVTAISQLGGRHGGVRGPAGLDAGGAGRRGLGWPRVRAGHRSHRGPLPGTAGRAALPHRRAALGLTGRLTAESGAGSPIARLAC